MEKKSFEYTYSSTEQEEIRKIREKYLPKGESRLEQLRRLDASAQRPGTIAALSLGISGALLFGLGMACTMVWQGALFYPGILIGVVGMVGMALAYPLCRRITRKKRAEIADEILRLSGED